MTETGMHFLGIAEFSEAKRLHAALKERGIPITLMSNPDHCSTKTCRPGLEMFVAEEHLPSVVEFLKQEKARDIGDLEINPELLNEVFDTEKETARCPACGETFSTKLFECPGCGLGFGGPAETPPVEDPTE